MSVHPSQVCPIKTLARQKLVNLASMSSAAFRTRLLQAKWFAFDLDDTLHSYRSASNAAISSTLALILTQHPNLNSEELRTSYTRILRSGTKAAFVDGRTSHEHRVDRFRLLLGEHGIETDEDQVKDLLECYESNFTANLELKPGALSLLQVLKAQGKKIVIITEGPQDAQERTLKALGLVPFVDYLATTNKLGVSKVDGMFERVLETLQVKAKEIVIVGDSCDRDIAPALSLGIPCIWFNESSNTIKRDGVVQIKTLKELEAML
jgi:putative hydrolase of the HAD superfamily